MTVVEKMASEDITWAKEMGRIETLAQLRDVPDDEVRNLLSRAQIAGGHPADDEDLSNDAVIGREFIRLRHKIAAMIDHALSEDHRTP